jgi:hypothetical protein
MLQLYFSCNAFRYFEVNQTCEIFPLETEKYSTFSSNETDSSNQIYVNVNLEKEGNVLFPLKLKHSNILQDFAQFKMKLLFS